MPTSRPARSARRRRRVRSRFKFPIKVNGRLQTPDEFKQIVVAAQPNGGYLRLGDVADVELGAQNYVTSARYNGRTSVVLAIEGEPTANSLQISKTVRATMERLKPYLPEPAWTIRSPSIRRTSCGRRSRKSSSRC